MRGMYCNYLFFKDTADAGRSSDYKANFVWNQLRLKEEWSCVTDWDKKETRDHIFFSCLYTLKSYGKELYKFVITDHGKRLLHWQSLNLEERKKEFMAVLQGKNKFYTE
ncbi:hypothetical protein GOBAR_AA31939 [Gossypium barbadense]|uniref:Uncharacterized protein n=1 Tax=Gossypium barbadense TaxID=3634 RepID=A0A2P5WCD9_GOSBA|nr:hypothetical protein GOBAR_AA31939 [Gossypium barbadense]